MREPADARFSPDDFLLPKRRADDSRVTITAFAADVTALRFTEADLDVVRIERSFAVMWRVYPIRGTVCALVRFSSRPTDPALSRATGFEIRTARLPLAWSRRASAEPRSGPRRLLRVVGLGQLAHTFRAGFDAVDDGLVLSTAVRQVRGRDVSRQNSLCASVALQDWNYLPASRHKFTSQIFPKVFTDVKSNKNRKGFVGVWNASVEQRIQSGFNRLLCSLVAPVVHGGCRDDDR